MARLSSNFSIPQFQEFIQRVYGLPDDRLFSVWDLISNQERFTMRALKGIRKGDNEKLKTNLLISFSYLIALVNRLHIKLEESIWDRFPYVCSYCRKAPCVCKKEKQLIRKKGKGTLSMKPRSLSQYQEMFRTIYPPEKRTLFEVGVHLAEEMGELSEAVHIFLGEHKNEMFDQIENEMADYVSCFFGVANSAHISLSKEFTTIYKNNCHACHKAPCICTFSFIAKFKS